MQHKFIQFTSIWICNNIDCHGPTVKTLGKYWIHVLRIYQVSLIHWDQNKIVDTLQAMYLSTLNWKKIFVGNQLLRIFYFGFPMGNYAKLRYKAEKLCAFLLEYEMLTFRPTIQRITLCSGDTLIYFTCKDKVPHALFNKIQPMFQVVLRRSTPCRNSFTTHLPVGRARVSVNIIVPIFDWIQPDDSPLFAVTQKRRLAFQGIYKNRFPI